MSRIAIRAVDRRAIARLTEAGMPEFLARLYAARGVKTAAELDYQLKALLPPGQMKGIEDAARLLADAIASRQKMLIVADYDCDGATACAVGIRGLRAMGADADYLVPLRDRDGYGLTVAIVEQAAQRKPAVLITVDNGIASIEGVAAAQRLGITTLVTDHHLPGDTLPDAAAIVNPNQPGCPFPSKHIAGVGVMFYTLMALRSELRSRGHFADRPMPNLASLLDLVALGTVADVVRLDHNNRILVHQGLARMRSRCVQPGILALFSAAGRDPATATTFDLGFALAPRLNAAGRLADMSLGIECLITDDPRRALEIAGELDALNQERRGIEQQMRGQAEAMLSRMNCPQACALALFDPDWHQGVIGILAGRIKEQRKRPVIAFARAEAGLLKGSGRSIAGIHLRDALDLVSKREPGLLLAFGGHAMAAGLTIAEQDFERFARVFTGVIDEISDPSLFDAQLETDGPLAPQQMTLEAARMLERGIWGQGFPAPLFADDFEVAEQRLLKDQHVKLTLRKGDAVFEAIRFRHPDPAPDRLRLAYRLSCNEYRGVQSLQLLVDDWEER